MQLDYSHILETDPLPLLLHESPIHVRYHALTRLLNLPSDTSTVQSTREIALKESDMAKIIRQQTSGGVWPPSTKFTQEAHKVGAQFLSQVQHLHQAYDLGATREDQFVKQGIVALLKMQLGDGKFPLFFQHQGYALKILLDYGMQGNPFVELGLRWLFKRQRPDGGWLHPVQVPRGKNAKDVDSCIWTTLHAVWPMPGHTRNSRDARTRKAVEYVLDHFLEANHTGFLDSPDAWDYLYIGHDDLSAFRGGTLKMLEIASGTGFTRDHPVINKATRWLREQQLENGLFPAISGKDTNGDFMVTLRSALVLKQLYRDQVAFEN